MPDDLFRVFTGGVSISKQLEMSERQNLELEEERNDCQMKDGNSKGSSISSDLGVLTACQKHLPINLYTYSMCVWEGAREHDSCLRCKLGCKVIGSGSKT